MIKSDNIGFSATRFKYKKDGHETSLMVYGAKENLETDYDNLIFLVSNICLLPIKEYVKLIEKSKKKKLAKNIYNSFDKIYVVLYQLTLTWYFREIEKPNFNYKHQYEKFFNRILDENSCPIISEVQEDYNLRESFLDVFSKVVKHAILNKIDNADGVLYTSNANPKKRQKTELGELVFSKIINAVYYSALQFIRNDATRHILDGSAFFKKMEAIPTNTKYQGFGDLNFCGYFKLKNESIAVNLCYNILIEGGFILGQRNSFKIFKSIFKQGEKRIENKIDWHKDIKTLVYFIRLLHFEAKDGQITAPCEIKSDLYTIADEFFTFGKKKIGVDRLRNNNRLLKNKIDIEIIKKAVNSLNSSKK